MNNLRTVKDINKWKNNNKKKYYKINTLITKCFRYFIKNLFFLKFTLLLFYFSIYSSSCFVFASNGELPSISLKTNEPPLLHDESSSIAPDPSSITSFRTSDSGHLEDHPKKHDVLEKHSVKDPSLELTPPILFYEILSYVSLEEIAFLQLPSKKVMLKIADYIQKLYEGTIHRKFYFLLSSFKITINLNVEERFKFLASKDIIFHFRRSQIFFKTFSQVVQEGLYLSLKQHVLDLPEHFEHVLDLPEHFEMESNQEQVKLERKLTHAIEELTKMDNPNIKTPKNTTLRKLFNSHNDIHFSIIQYLDQEDSWALYCVNKKNLDLLYLTAILHYVKKDIHLLTEFVVKDLNQTIKLHLKLHKTKKSKYRLIYPGIFDFYYIIIYLIGCDPSKEQLQTLDEYIGDFIFKGKILSKTFIQDYNEICNTSLDLLNNPTQDVNDSEKIISWSEKLKKNPFVSSKTHSLLGEIFCQIAENYEDRGGADNNSKAIRWYQLAANQGDAITQYNLGVYYEGGEIVEKNLPKAFYWCQLAANQGLAQAQYQLGDYYKFGRGVNKDLSKASHYYQLAANKGHTQAQSMLATLYIRGTGTTKNPEKGLHLLQLAAEQEDAHAQYNLGVLYLKGEGVTKNVEKGLHFLQLAVNQGDAYAQSLLGWSYVTGESVTKNVEKGLHLLQLALNQGHAQAQYNLGVLYLKGEGVTKNVGKGLHFLQLSANQGHAHAQYNLGVLYLKGEGVTKNVEKGLRLLREVAINQKLAEAQYDLGVLFIEGIVIKKNVEAGLRLIQLAAGQEHLRAQNYLKSRASSSSSSSSSSSFSPSSSSSSSSSFSSAAF